MSSSVTPAGQAVLPRRAIRSHDVTAIIVAHDGEQWLPRVLASLAASQRRPDRVIAVDTGSTDRTGDLLAASDVVDTVITCARDTGFGAAVAAAVAQDRDPGVIDLRDDSLDLRQRPAPDPVRWLWLLHDDSAVRPDTLGVLLRRADRLPGAAVVGPKARAWRRPSVVLECGIALSGSGRPETGVIKGEVDQGQLDGRVDVMAVSSAGMLVARDVWDELSGFAPEFAAGGADTDFCWRVRRAGHRVVVAPDAVIVHRRAATAGQRHVDCRRGSARYNHRRTAVTTALVHSPAWRLVFTVVRTAIGGLLRFLLGLLLLSPRRAWDDLSGTGAALASSRTVTAARRRTAAHATVSDRELRHLRPSVAQRVAHWYELVARPGRRDVRGPATTEIARSVRAVALTVVVLAVVCLIATWSLWFGDGRILGGALLPAPDSGWDLIATFWSPWHEVGLGSDIAAPPYLGVVAAVSVGFLGSAPAALQAMLLLAPIAAGAAALAALRGLVRGPARVAAALAYALLPATVVAIDTGRLGTAMAAVVLPFAARLLMRISGFATPVPPGTRRTVVAGAFVVALLGAFAPALAITAVVATSVACLVGGHGRGFARVLLVAAASAALLWPWSGHLLAHPGLLLLEIGAHPDALSRPIPPVWQLGLLNPGGAGAAPAFVAVALVLVAGLALIPARTRRAAVAAWLIVLAGLCLAVLQVMVPVAAPWSVTAVRSWAGPGTLLMGLGTVAAAAVAAAGLAGAWRRRVAVAAVLVAPIMVGGWWVAQGQPIVTRADPGVVSPFVTAASLGPEAPRTLALHQGRGGSVSYELLSGPGLRLGDADMAPDADTMADFSGAVSRMATGSAAALEEVAGAAVRFVTVDISRNRTLARQLDAVPGLRRVSAVSRRGLWEVSEPIARSRAITPTGPVPLAADPTAPGLTASGPIPADAPAVEIAELPSDVWRATVAGRELPPVAGPWQRFEIPAGTAGDVGIAPDPMARLLPLVVPALALLLLVIAALRPPDRPRTAVTS